jgi:hypothetical protein
MKELVREGHVRILGWQECIASLYWLLVNELPKTGELSGSDLFGEFDSPQPSPCTRPQDLPPPTLNAACAREGRANGPRRHGVALRKGSKFIGQKRPNKPSFPGFYKFQAGPTVKVTLGSCHAQQSAV